MKVLNMAQKDKIKTHFIENKKLYIGIGVGILVGATGVFFVTRNPTEMNVNNKIQQILSWKPKATIEVYIEALGDPGNIVQDMTTGTIYASQGQASRAIGATASDMSKHLSGARAHLDGHVFEKLGKAPVSQ